MDAFSSALELVAADSDDLLQQWLDVHNHVVPRHALSLDELAHFRATAWTTNVLALHEGTPIAAALAYEEWWAPDSQARDGSIEVLPQWRSRGVGSVLYRTLSKLIADQGATALRVTVYEDDPDSVAFWRHRSFEQVEKAMESVLELDDVQLPPLPELPSGVTIRAIAEDEGLLRALHQVYSEAVPDIPGDEAQRFPPFERWLALEVQAPYFRPEAAFVAFAGEEPAGGANLDVFAMRRDEAWHGLTAVRREFRNRGIARALKIRTLHWARQNGIVRLRTENEERNAPMRHINESLGYRLEPAGLRMRGPLAANETAEPEERRRETTLRS